MDDRIVRVRLRDEGPCGEMVVRQATPEERQRFGIDEFQDRQRHVIDGRQRELDAKAEARRKRDREYRAARRAAARQAEAA